jgi:hypothetical protein
MPAFEAPAWKISGVRWGEGCVDPLPRSLDIFLDSLFYGF